MATRSTRHRLYAAHTPPRTPASPEGRAGLSWLSAGGGARKTMVMIVSPVVLSVRCQRQEPSARVASQGLDSVREVSPPVVGGVPVARFEVGQHRHRRLASVRLVKGSKPAPDDGAEAGRSRPRRRADAGNSRSGEGARAVGGHG